MTDNTQIRKVVKGCQDRKVSDMSDKKEKADSWRCPLFPERSIQPS